MKALILFLVFSSHVYAESENEVVTQEQFEKIQAEREAKETNVSYLPTSNELVNNPDKYGNKKFKVLVIGDTIVAPTGNSKACNFNYIKLVDDSGFENKTGFGHYVIESLKGIGCKRLIAIKGQDSSSITLLVEFVSFAKAPHKPSKIIPVLDVIKVE